MRKVVAAWLTASLAIAPGLASSVELYSASNWQVHLAHTKNQGTICRLTVILSSDHALLVSTGRHLSRVLYLDRLDGFTVGQKVLSVSAKDYHFEVPVVSGQQISVASIGAFDSELVQLVQVLGTGSFDISVSEGPVLHASVEENAVAAMQWSLCQAKLKAQLPPYSIASAD